MNFNSISPFSQSSVPLDSQNESPQPAPTELSAVVQTADSESEAKEEGVGLVQKEQLSSVVEKVFDQVADVDSNKNYQISLSRCPLAFNYFGISCRSHPGGSPRKRGAQVLALFCKNGGAQFIHASGTRYDGRSFSPLLSLCDIGA